MPATGDSDAETSLGFEQAAECYGVPDMIKMDIEGGEADFLISPKFKHWIVKNNIVLMIELHSPEAEKSVWTDLPVRWVDSRHVVLNTTLGGNLG